MKRFQFKLQAVLTLRQREEQVALERYARAVQGRQTAAGRLAGVEMEVSEARRQWLNALADGCPAAHAAQVMAFAHNLEELRRKAEQTLQLADVEVSQASHEMMLARQQREAVEHYLSRLRAGHERDLRNEERKLIDDLVGRRLPVSLSGRAPARTTWNLTAPEP